VSAAACRTRCSPPARKRFSRRAHWLSEPDLRQHSHTGLNKGEASNSVRRAVFFHRQGEIRDRTFENQSFRASGLSPSTAAIVHWNTVARTVRLIALSSPVPTDSKRPEHERAGWIFIARDSRPFLSRRVL
jgi:hypothetical protein